jgi:hypothetical protein
LNIKIIGAAADKAAANKKNKYAALQHTQLVVTVSVETMSSWNADSITFIYNIGKKLTEVSADPLETSYLFQRLFIHLLVLLRTLLVGCMRRGG